MADTVCCIETLGGDQYELYVTERLVNQNVPITDPIKGNNLYISSSMISHLVQLPADVSSVHGDKNLTSATLNRTFKSVNQMSHF